MVKAFLAEGASVVNADVTAPAAGSSARGSKTEAATYVNCDVSNEDSVERLVEVTASRFGRLDVMVANADISIEKNVVETTVEEWDRSIDINLKGVFLCCKHAVPIMQKQSGGSIIAMGSALSHVAEPRLAAYCASKGGIGMLIRSVATDFGRDGIRANYLCPGYIETALT